MELINREEALQKIREMPIEYFGKSLTRKSVIMGELEELPIIESRSKGKWVKYKGEIYGFECSVCGKPAPLESEYGAYPCEKTIYCPNCGAEMGE